MPAKVRCHVSVSSIAQRGFQDSKVTKVSETSKQLDDFLNHKCPRCGKPLLWAGLKTFNDFMLYPFIICSRYNNCVNTIM
jgi:ssDNA-binding Zn-finger/Zn-ribbon topoisomerase 1